MKGKLLWSLHNDMVASRIPSNHVVIFGFLEKTERRDMVSEDSTNSEENLTYA